MKFDMKIFFALSVLIFAGSLLAQSTILQERFLNGNAELAWTTADGISQMRTATLSGNPSGDQTVGYVKGQAQPINLGMIQVISSPPQDYRVEAQILIRRNGSASSGTNNGIMGRFAQTAQSTKGYVLAADFDSNNRLRLQKFTGPMTALATIRNWTEAEIPGGIPGVSGWHKLTLEFSGSQINAYFDDQLLPGSPLTDTESGSGTIGSYCFVGFDTPIDSVTYFDDVKVTSMPTSVEDMPTPTNFTLLQNYPNPFNPATTIVFNLEKSAFIQLDIHNLTGQKIATLVSGLWPAGGHNISWAATGLPSGVYLARLQTNGETLTKRMMLTK